MTTVGTELSMSLDGFMASPEDGVEHVFDWYGNGPVSVTMPNGSMVVQVSEASAGHLRSGFAKLGALVTGSERPTSCSNASTWGCWTRSW